VQKIDHVLNPSKWFSQDAKVDTGPLASTKTDIAGDKFRSQHKNVNYEETGTFKGGPPIDPNVAKIMKNLVQVESSGHPAAIPSKDSQYFGLTQMGNAQFKQYAPEGGKRTDEGAQVAAGANMLTALTKHYHGNIKNALEAYNWGSGNVDKVLGDKTGKRTVPEAVQQYANTIMSGIKPNGQKLGYSPGTDDIMDSAGVTKILNNGAMPAGFKAPAVKHKPNGNSALNFLMGNPTKQLPAFETGEGRGGSFGEGWSALKMLGSSISKSAYNAIPKIANTFVPFEQGMGVNTIQALQGQEPLAQRQNQPRQANTTTHSTVNNTFNIYGAYENLVNKLIAGAAL
jgi:hypothetical protein